MPSECPFPRALQIEADLKALEWVEALVLRERPTPPPGKRIAKLSDEKQEFLMEEKLLDARLGS